MPEIELQHVVSCSSADKNNPAENLLKSDGTHKWKCAAAGEKSVSCVLQLAKSSQIHSIDIGNEGSAFVEVLVGKATAASDQDFEVLLVASAFMSPLESRNGTNKNGVRMFGTDKLNNVTARQKWDRVKVVCTQPFSKLFQYGLSFIKFHSPPDERTDEKKVKKLGAFSVKDSEDDAGDDIKVGSIFANRAAITSTSTLPQTKGALAVRGTNKLVEEHIKTSSSTLTSTSVASTSRKRLSSPSPPSSSNIKASRKDEAPSRTESNADKDEEVAVKTSLKRKSTSLSSVSSTSSSTRGEKSDLKRSKTEPPSPSAAKAFSRLMEKVVFVLSGFQNPYRAELRDKAVEMGASYRPDWGRGCTHLVCAFPNTPKYQQVSGKGRIVTKGWILDCYKQKKLLPWRKYRLGDAATPDASSDDEVEVGSQTRTERKLSPLPSQCPTQSKELVPASKKGTRTVTYDDSDSGGDTEEELRKVKGKMEKEKGHETSYKNSKTTSEKDDDDDPYGGSTDEDDLPASDTLPIHDVIKDDGSDSGLPDLPDFFTDKHFLFYGNFDEGQQRLLTRYIAAYNGEVEEYMNKRVNFVVTAQKWDENFDMAVSENPQMIFVKPAWITACHEKNKLVPYQPYIVVP